MKNELINWVRTALNTEKIIDVGTDIVESGIDKFLNNDLVTAIPVLKTLHGVYQAAESISNQIFVKKLLMFVIEIHKTDMQDRMDMVKHLENEPEYANKVGERIIEILDRVDSYKKPKMIAVVFAAYARKEIDYETLCRLNGAIDKLNHYDMKYLRRFIDMSPGERSTMSDVVLNGFMNAGLAMASSAFGGFVYNQTSLCDTFIKLNIDLQ